MFSKKSIIVLSIVIVLVLASVWIFSRLKSIKAYPKSAEEYYKTDTSGLKIEKAEYAVVYNDSKIALKKLSKAETQNLLRILLDSANYHWGELGTPYFDRVVIYFDSIENDIGMTRISFDGQTYTYPSTERQTKFGLLKDLDAVQEIIK